MRVHVDLARYRAAHGRAPRGAGLWLFRWQTGMLHHLGSYAEAKRRAIHAARADGIGTVELLPWRDYAARLEARADEIMAAEGVELREPVRGRRVRLFDEGGPDDSA